jgi:hypothetical protein
MRVFGEEKNMHTKVFEGFFKNAVRVHIIEEDFP